MIQGDFKGKLKEESVHKQETIYTTLPDVELKVTEDWINRFTSLYNEILGKILM